MVNHDNALQVRESVIIYLGTIWLGESVLALEVISALDEFQITRIGNVRLKKPQRYQSLRFLHKFFIFYILYVIVIRLSNLRLSDRKNYTW